MKKRNRFLVVTSLCRFFFILLIGLGLPPGAWSATETLVPAGATWRFHDAGVDLGTAWRELTYNDSDWSYGPSQLGYGDGDEATLLNSSPVHSCYYFRHSFNVPDPARFSALTLQVLRDDGCVVYLNGQEVARYGMPAGEITYSTWASTASEYDWDAPLTIPNTLAAGDNVLAVEVHQGNSTSSDVSFDLVLIGTGEIGVVLNSPDAGATDVPVPALLAATVTDPQGQPLDVGFYGRPAPPVPPNFTIVVLPDTQFYTDEVNGATKEIFISQVEWILSNREARNIAYVAHLGDVSNNGDKYVDEWINATTALYPLESPIQPNFPDGIPYGVAVGNHDQIVPTGDTEPTSYYNQYFGTAHYAGRAYYGGHYGNNNNNHYQFFSASGMDFIVVYLEYDTTPDQAVLDWADALLKAHPQHRAIVVSHYLLELTGAWGPQGQAIYNALKDNPNLFLMLCGHNHGEARRADMYEGNTVHTLLSDYQDYPNGGNGFLRIMEFRPAQNQVVVSTYSPWLDQYETDSSSQFSLDYSMEFGPAFELVQVNAQVDSGSQTSAVWPGLTPGAEYEWYVVASNGSEAKSSERRRFTVSANLLPMVSITYPEHNAVFSAPADVRMAAQASDPDGQVVQVDFYAGAAYLGSDTQAPYEIEVTLLEGAYVLTAVASDNGGGMTVSAPVTITVGEAPIAPANLTATAQSTTEILLDWTDTSANETGFEVYQSLDGTAYSLIRTVEPNVTSVLVAGLQPSTSYYFIVRAVNGAGYADSNPASATTLTPPPVPATPAGVLAVPVSDKDIGLSWRGVSGAASYHVERSLDAEEWLLLRVVSADTISIDDTGLASGTVYYYRVTACNESGCSAPSSIAAAAPFVYSYANAETLVTGTLVGTRAATYDDDGDYEQLTEKLSGGKPSVRYSALEHKWTFTVTPGRSVVFFVQAHMTAGADGDRFVFAYSTEDVIYQNMVEISATADNGVYQSFELPFVLQGTLFVRVTDTDHTPGQTVLDTLFVDHILIRSDTSPLVGPPAAPVLQSALPGDQSVSLRWSASYGATAYNVWRRTEGESFTLIGMVIPDTAFTDTGLVNGTAYEYCVTALNEFGESIQSNVLNATLEAFTAPPTNLQATGAKKKIYLSWTQSATPGVTQNRVYRSSDGVSFAEHATLPAGTSYYDSVPSGSTYWYYVTALSTRGESEPSNTASARAK